MLGAGTVEVRGEMEFRYIGGLKLEYLSMKDPYTFLEIFCAFAQLNKTEVHVH